MEEQTIIEQCAHEWEDEDIYREYIGMSGTWSTEKAAHYRRVFVQRCKKCKKLNTVR